MRCVCAFACVPNNKCVRLFVSREGPNMLRGTFCTGKVCVHAFVCVSYGFALAKIGAAML